MKLVMRTVRTVCSLFLQQLYASEVRQKNGIRDCLSCYAGLQRNTAGKDVMVDFRSERHDIWNYSHRGRHHVPWYWKQVANMQLVQCQVINESRTNISWMISCNITVIQA